jgi:hypothetical protein
MRTYEKPMILANEELAEGVYAASGDTAVSTGSANVSYSLKDRAAWDGNRQYDIYLTNNSSETVHNASVTVSVNGTVTSITGYNLSVVRNGDKAVITYSDDDHGIAANTTTGAFTLWLTGQGDFSLS